MKRTLILFYSFEGTTRRVAEFLSSELKLTIEEIKPVKDLSSTGFSKFIWGGRQVIMKKKPELVPLTVNLDDYDTIILGTPVWAGSYTPAIKTLLEDGILKGKNIACFYCHDGGPRHAEKNIRQEIEKNNNYISSIGLYRPKDKYDALKGDVLDWAKKIQTIDN